MCSEEKNIFNPKTQKAPRIPNSKLIYTISFNYAKRSKIFMLLLGGILLCGNT